jgi:hypothetical protein
MNTQNQQIQKKNQQRTRQDQGSKTKGQPNLLHRKQPQHEQEQPETRLFR